MSDRWDEPPLPGGPLETTLRSDPDWDAVLAVKQVRARPGDRAICDTRAHVAMLHLDPPYPSTWRIDGSAVTVLSPEGSLSLIKCGASVQWLQPHESQVLTAALDGAFVDRLALRTIRRQVCFPNRPGLADPGVARILFALWSELRQGCPAGLPFWESLATALGVYLLHHHVPARLAPRPPEADGGLLAARMRRAIDFMEANHGESISLRDLADAAAMSTSQFARRFREATGLPPHRYLMQLRVERAKEMLGDANRSLTEIAQALGYSSQAHFTTAFRKLAGMPPGSYRAKISGADGIAAASDDAAGPENADIVKRDRPYVERPGAAEAVASE